MGLKSVANWVSEGLSLALGLMASRSISETIYLRKLHIYNKVNQRKKVNQGEGTHRPSMPSTSAWFEPREVSAE